MFPSSRLFLLTNKELSSFFAVAGELEGFFLLNLLPEILKLPKEQNSPLRKGVFLQNEGEIAIGKGCVIEEGAYLEGPCKIGDGTEVRHGAYIRRGSVIGNDCIIGHATEVNRSLVLDGARLSHFNYVGDSVIGEGANFGAGSKCANLRLDEKEVAIFFEGKKVFTGRKKFGALVGHGASIGCNAVLNPGTVLFPNAKVPPCISVKGVIL